LKTQLDQLIVEITYTMLCKKIMLILKFAVCFALTICTVAGNHVKLTETAAFDLFAGQFGENGYSNDGFAATAAKMRSAWSIWGDQSGRIFFSDPKSHTIRMIRSADGIINRFAGQIDISGAATDNVNALAAFFNRPHGVYGDDVNQKLWVCDTMNHVIREIDIGNSPYLVTTIGK
jgi:hypothetical protein